MEPFLVFAFAAMLCWGVGDFLLQRSARKTTVIETLAFVGIVGIVALFPFVLGDLFRMGWQDTLVLVVLGVLTFLAAIFDLEALKEGKLAVIDVIIALELPLTVILGVAMFKETLTHLQVGLIIALLIGLILVSIEFGALHRFTLEKGVYFALLAAIGMALVNYLTAHSARSVSPIMAIWFPAVVFTAMCFIILGTRKRFVHFVRDIKGFGWLFVAMAVIDTAAWVFYAYATKHGELAITTAITESYPVIAMLLGVHFNKEWIGWHQWLGAALALGASVLLAVL